MSGAKGSCASIAERDAHDSRRGIRAESIDGCGVAHPIDNEADSAPIASTNLLQQARSFQEPVTNAILRCIPTWRSRPECAVPRSVGVCHARSVD
jgi:hypothetical protein